MATTIDSALFGDVWSTAEMRAIWSDEAMVQRWLDVEAALARAEAELGIIPREHAEEISRRARVELIDLVEMKRELDHTKHPIVPLIRCLQRVCAPAAGEWIHWGATTQDIMDTGLVLQLKAANAIVVRDVERIAEILADLAQRHKATVQAGRTHGQQALPITFGYKVAVWTAEVRRHRARLDQMAPRVFPRSVRGRGRHAGVDRAARAQAAGGDVRGPRPGRAGHHLAHRAGRDGRADLRLRHDRRHPGEDRRRDHRTPATEVAEVEEPFHMGKVGSGTMPHKRNPAMCEGVVALGRMLQAQVAPALTGMLPSNERDKRGNLAEGAFLSEACCLLSGILATMSHLRREVGTEGMVSRTASEHHRESLGREEPARASEKGSARANTMRVWPSARVKARPSSTLPRQRFGSTLGVSRGGRAHGQSPRRAGRPPPAARGS